MDERKWESNIISYITDTMIKKSKNTLSIIRPNVVRIQKKKKLGPNGDMKE